MQRDGDACQKQPDFLNWKRVPVQGAGGNKGGRAVCSKDSEEKVQFEPMDRLSVAMSH